jgi:dehydrogenase/reductase SDR family member 1
LLAVSIEILSRKIVGERLPSFKLWRAAESATRSNVSEGAMRDSDSDRHEEKRSLLGRVALVTGASRGVGRGIALALADAGVVVYGTGRTIEKADLPGAVLRACCDHRDDSQVEAVFERIRRERGRLDVLVNNAWGGYERMVENGEFTWMRPFWQQPRWRWDAMMNAGVRAAFVASQLAARTMVEARSGLIVNISFWAARKHIGNALYGCAKAATDKLTTDMAQELKSFGVAVVSLYPGLVRTEAVMAAAGAFDLSNSESPEFIGRAVAALAGDRQLMNRTGRVLIAAQLGLEYRFTDTDGRQPQALDMNTV